MRCDALAHNAYVAMLAERELRNIRGYLARRGFLERLIRLSKDLAWSAPGALFSVPGQGLPRTWGDLERVAWRKRRWARRRGVAVAFVPKDGAPEVAPEWCSTGRAAKLLGVDAHTVAAWCDAGRLAHVRLPSGHRRVPMAAVEAWLRAQQAEAQPDLKALAATMAAACAAPDQDPPTRRRR